MGISSVAARTGAMVAPFSRTLVIELSIRTANPHQWIPTLFDTSNYFSIQISPLILISLTTTRWIKKLTFVFWTLFVCHRLSLHLFLPHCISHKVRLRQVVVIFHISLRIFKLNTRLAAHVLNVSRAEWNR